MTDGQSGLRYEIKNGILQVVHPPKSDGGQPVRQVVVLKQLPRQLMELAHQSILCVHMGSRRTIDRVLSNLY